MVIQLQNPTLPIGGMNDSLKGRGAQFNPKNKFLAGAYVQAYAEAIDEWEVEKRETEYIYDNSQTLVNKVTSPDVGMQFSVNPYQGCEHGCVYCYARNTHEYWGYSAGVDFESRIVVKKNAAALLKKCLEAKAWVPATLSFSGNTDCYQPMERKMRLTRTMLEICLDFRNPVSILTKNALVLRDLDILQEMQKLNLVTVTTSITSLDENLRQKNGTPYLNLCIALKSHRDPIGSRHTYRGDERPYCSRAERCPYA